MLLSTILMACGGDTLPSTFEGPTEETSPPPAPEWADPFAAQPDTSEGLVNVSDDLDSILEHGALIGACDRYRADPEDRYKKLLCGKSMFFYEGFGTIGIPEVLFDFAHQRFEDIVGPGFSGFGLVPHPNSAEGRPIGFGVGAPLGTVPTQAFTCAGCHFGPLPDGRYAVGAPNHDYAYGHHMLALTLMPEGANPLFDEAEHHPDAVALVRPMLDRLADEPLLAIELGIALLPLLSYTDQGTMTYEIEGQYAAWLPGTMDFLISPLPLDDETHTVSKILPLWAIADEAEAQSHGMDHAALAWTGAATSLMEFLEGFVAIGVGDSWSREDLEPLQDYILSLRAPPDPTLRDPEAVVRGSDLFVGEGCIDCHDGPRGAGWIYSYDEIGTDDAMEAWGDPDPHGTFCCGFEGTPTLGVKSPRLVGMWAQRAFLHNGTVRSLDALLCSPDRPTRTDPVFADVGHRYGCDLSVSDREDLIAYLLAH